MRWARTQALLTVIGSGKKIWRCWLPASVTIAQCQWSQPGRQKERATTRKACRTCRHPIEVHSYERSLESPDPRPDTKRDNYNNINNNHVCFFFLLHPTYLRFRQEIKHNLSIRENFAGFCLSATAAALVWINEHEFWVATDFGSAFSKAIAAADCAFALISLFMSAPIDTDSLRLVYEPPICTALAILTDDRTHQRPQTNEQTN